MFKSRAQRHYWSFGCWVRGRGERALIVQRRRWKNQQSVQSRMGASCRLTFVMEKHSHSNIKSALVLLINMYYDNFLYQSVCAWHVVLVCGQYLINTIWTEVLPNKNPRSSFCINSVLIGVNLESLKKTKEWLKLFPSADYVVERQWAWEEQRNRVIGGDLDCHFTQKMARSTRY